MGRAFTGEAAAGLRAGSSTPLVVESVLKVKDEAAVLAVAEKSAALLAPGGPWQGLFADLAVPVRVTLQKNVRRRAGVRVHRLRMAAEPKALAALPAERRAQYAAALLRDTEFAIARGLFVSAQETAALDALLDRATAGRAPAPPPLQAVQVFGEGAQVYIDYDVFAVMRAVTAALPTPAGTPNPFDGLPAMEGRPFVYAGWLADQRIRLRSKVPLTPFAAMVEAIRKASPAKVTPAP
jgi:hypothetical protein